jgi:hypothetical protein
MLGNKKYAMLATWQKGTAEGYKPPLAKRQRGSNATSACRCRLGNAIGHVTDDHDISRSQYRAALLITRNVHRARQKPSKQAKLTQSADIV